MKLYIPFHSPSRKFLRIRVLIKISVSDLDDFVNKARAPASPCPPLCNFIQLQFLDFEQMNVNNMICAVLLVAKYYGAENHSLYFMIVQKSLISLLVMGIQESLKILLSYVSRLNSLQVISFKQTGFNVAGYQGYT